MLAGHPSESVTRHLKELISAKKIVVVLPFTLYSFFFWVGGCLLDYSDDTNSFGDIGKQISDITEWNSGVSNPISSNSFTDIVIDLATSLNE